MSRLLPGPGTRSATLDDKLDLDELAPETIRPIRRGEYDRMVEAGLFADERVELLRGMLVAMSP